MSKVKFSENLFLEVAELNRMVKFLREETHELVSPLITKAGIVINEGNTYFKPVKTDNTSVSLNPGIAVTNDLEIIKLISSYTISNITNTGSKQWIVIGRKTSTFEEGTISVAIDGSVIGVNTKFTEIFRGQPNFPTKVKIDSAVNTNEYEVVSVTSDTQMTIAGDLEAESGKRFSVIGAFTPGFVPTEQNKYIYEFDDCEVSLISSDNTPTITSDQFIVGYVQFDEGVLNVYDERIYNLANTDYSESELSGESNLSTLLRISTLNVLNSDIAKSVDFELIFQHTHRVITYSITSDENYNIFSMTLGTDGYYGTGSIPNNIFNGWNLINRKNGKSVKIDYNLNKNLYISIWDSEIVEAEDNDFIVAPPFDEIEYEVTVNSSNVPSNACSFYFKNSVFNPFTRCRIYALFPSAGGASTLVIGMRYRFISKSRKDYSFKKFPTAGYLNIRGNSQLLYNSQLSIDMTTLNNTPSDNNTPSVNPNPAIQIQANLYERTL